MFDGQPYREEFQRRISTIRRLLDSGDPTEISSTDTGVSREIRGLAVLLLFASYENLLTSLCRGLLERATRLRAGNRRLKTGFRQFSIYNLLVSISNSSDKKIWEKTGRDLLNCAFDGRNCTINVDIFPSDGSFMKKSQVYLFFSIFGLGDPGSILREIWERLDTIVVERNKIAHGSLTPEEVGRNYSSEEIRNLVEKWEKRWIEAINHIETKASNRDFYLNRR